MCVRPCACLYLCAGVCLEFGVYVCATMCVSVSVRGRVFRVRCVGVCDHVRVCICARACV